MKSIRSSSTMGRIAEIVKLNPGVGYQEILLIAKEMHGYGREHVSSSLNRLYTRGSLKRDGNRRFYKYYFIERQETDPRVEREDISLEDIMSKFSYDPETGDITRKSSRYQAKIGENPCKIRGGYLFLDIKNHSFFAHRIAWVLFYGRWPKKIIDHINGIGTDNRMCNLREATHSQNQGNIHAKPRSKTGYRGVGYSRNGQKFVARINLNGKLIHLGTFDTAEIAYEKYKQEAREKFGEFFTDNSI